MVPGPTLAQGLWKRELEMKPAAWWASKPRDQAVRLLAGACQGWRGRSRTGQQTVKGRLGCRPHPCESEAAPLLGLGFTLPQNSRAFLLSGMYI